MRLSYCRFWLRGHCLKQNCDFLHEYVYTIRGACPTRSPHCCRVPPHLLQDVANMRLAGRGREREPGGGTDSEGEGMGQGEGDEEFPTLSSTAIRPRRDPATTRWAGAVKNGRAVSLGGTIPLNRPEGAFGVIGKPKDKPRPSPRITLRPPTLLPTLEMGKDMATLYEAYRGAFVQVNAARSRCLTKAYVQLISVLPDLD
jgi:hypothetical protein